MTVEEYIACVKKCEIDTARQKILSKKYGKDISGIVMNMISYAKNSIFIDEERRVLSFDEIIEFDLNYDFTVEEYGIIPVVDCFDNDFIVYLINEDKWAKFNTSDKCIFKKRSTFEELV